MTEEILSEKCVSAETNGFGRTAADQVVESELQVRAVWMESGDCKQPHSISPLKKDSSSLYHSC